VVEDYRATGMTLRRHPLALMRSQLDALGCGDTRQLNTSRAGSGCGCPGWY
jgi:error-prone DNA polymerase